MALDLRHDAYAILATTSNGYFHSQLDARFVCKLHVGLSLLLRNSRPFTIFME